MDSIVMGEAPTEYLAGSEICHTEPPLAPSLLIHQETVPTMSLSMVFDVSSST